MKACLMCKIAVAVVVIAAVALMNGCHGVSW